MNNVNATWVELLSAIHREGMDVAPRGQKTKELLQYTSVVNMECPVITIPDRKMNYNFMFGEAYFILSGSNRASDITPFMKAIGNFSDDGVTFNGAYGPKIMEQVSYVVSKLNQDKHSRQALLTIWRERPHDSKDIPCTVSLQFMIRDGKLNCHAYMRSSDSWLGWVYDVFNFSMVSHYICNWLNILNDDQVMPGHLFLTAASQHIYQSNMEVTAGIIADVTTRKVGYSTFNSMFNNYEHPDELVLDLLHCGHGKFDKVKCDTKAIIGQIVSELGNKEK